MPADDLLNAERTEALIVRMHASKQPLDEDRRKVLRAHLTTALELIYTYVGATSWMTIPESVIDTTLLTVARDLETRDKSPGGVFAAFGEHDGAIRLARDPLTPVYPVLQRYMRGGFA